MQEQKITTTGTDPATISEQETEKITPAQIYKNNIYALVDDVKQEPQFINKSDEELKQDKSFFPILVDYIYDNYIGDLLGNKKNKYSVSYDIGLLDYIFNIYTKLVYLYKWNNKPNILEFSILTGISRESIYKWLNGDIDNIPQSDNERRSITRDKIDTVQKWITVCENALVDGNDTIRDIFLLKAKHSYNDRNNDINITVNHKNIVSADDLPALIGVENGDK